jgi:hypothetical protein
MLNILHLLDVAVILRHTLYCATGVDTDENRSCNAKESEMAAYNPEPIDTSQVELPGHLADLTEKLAENAHDNWAAMRLTDGWTWGPERDDELKKHPDLVPYGELSQSEKQYDRAVAMETLKAILAMGYRIEPA